MSEFSQIGDKVLEQVLALFQARGIDVCEMLPHEGALVVKNAAGKSAQVSLVHLVNHYYRTRDDSALTHFADTIATSLKQGDAMAWEEARHNIYCSLHHAFTEMHPPFAKEFSAYSVRHYIVDMPDKTQWITQKLLDCWGVSEDMVQRQALENGDSLLAQTDLDIKKVNGCMLGSFHVQDASLKAALLLAPSFKAKVSPLFGWPLYVVVPNKRLCSFFKKSDYPALKPVISHFVGTNYDEPKRVSPELLEMDDTGVRTVCTWLLRSGYLMEFES